MRPPLAPLALLLMLGVCCGLGAAQARYWGRELGSLSQLHHGVRGRLFAVDARTIYLQDFHYDGEGPAAFFYVGTSKTPMGGEGAGAARLRDERGGTGPLRRYRGEALTLSLPEGTTLRDFRWFSVWCDEFSVNFGDVQWSRDAEFPRPARVGALRGVHGVASDPVVVVDAQTLLVPNFSYDGEAPDAKFWVGRGDKPSPQGIRIPDENGKEVPLRKYDKKTIVLTLPGELTVFDIGHFGVWCEAFTVNFGHVVLPHEQLANVPPSLKMLGVSPQSRNKALVGERATTLAPPAPRRPLQRVEATTYRPAAAARLGAGPPALLAAAPALAHEHLQRRADSYAPSPLQLLTGEPTDGVRLEPSREVFYQKIDVPPSQQQQAQPDNTYFIQRPQSHEQKLLVYQGQPQNEQQSYRVELLPHQKEQLQRQQLEDLQTQQRQQYEQQQRKQFESQHLLARQQELLQRQQLEVQQRNRLLSQTPEQFKSQHILPEQQLAIEQQQEQFQRQKQQEEQQRRQSLLQQQEQLKQEQQRLEQLQQRQQQLELELRRQQEVQQYYRQQAQRQYNPPPSVNLEMLQQEQLYQQNRMQYEQRLFEEQDRRQYLEYPQQFAPVQASPQNVRRGRELAPVKGNPSDTGAGEVSIQRSVDLDLVAGSGPQ